LENLVHPVQAYVARKRLKTMLTAIWAKAYNIFVSRPLQESLEASQLNPLRGAYAFNGTGRAHGEERSQFFIPASCSNKKGSLAPGGELVIHIHRLGGYECQ